MKSTPLHLKPLALLFCIIALLTVAGFYIADIDTDITRHLPQADPVLTDASAIFRHHPMQDQIAIDLSLEKEDRELLIRCAAECEILLEKSGLFKSVGLNTFQSLMPELADHVVKHLPLLFSKKDLETQIAPKLAPEALEQRLREMQQSLLGLDGIGQSAFFARDPLEMKNLVMARLVSLIPTMDVQIHQGRLLSADGRHLLLPAAPKLSGTDTAFARQMNNEMERISGQLKRVAADKNNRLVMTPVGAYRAALDNEMIARKDVNRAILLAAFGIALLLFIAFPRPWMGLLAFLPALAGTAAAFFICALWHRTLSIMALGFGGAIISITVDHGIAYLLFLDQPQQVHGRDASEKIRSIGLIAALTTMGAFGMLCFSGFPIFQQLGLFTALGIGFSFLFIHTVFPKLFPVMPPAKYRPLPLRNLVLRLTSFGKKGAWAALVFGMVMIFFARPEFNVDLSSMNTVSRETSKAESLMTEVWGRELFSKVYLMTEGKKLAELQAEWDRLLKQTEMDVAEGVLEPAFTPAMIFPGEERRKENFKAWKAFWHPERREEFKRELTASATELGFSPDAFDPFYEFLSAEYEQFGKPEVPESFFELLSIRKKTDGTGWSQFSTLSPGASYEPDAFYKIHRGFGPVFDANYFSQRLGELLFSSFMKMLVIIGAGVALLLFAFFLDWKLTLTGLLPVMFALFSTLGTLKLIGHPLDIPGLMLSIIIFGMGIDYSLYMVRAYQRYGDENHPDLTLIKTSVFMASASTLIGFGVLVFSAHSLLRSAGLTSLIGIAYSLTGAFVILPPLLSSFFRSGSHKPDATRTINQRVLWRYRRREAYPRLFARFKLKYDILFDELTEFLPESLKNPGFDKRILDVGCGYGVPAAWMLEKFPEAIVYGFDPDRERVRVASLVSGEKGHMKYGYAPEIPDLPEPMDVVLMLDIIHFLTDEDLEKTLQGLKKCLVPGGKLIIRAVIPPIENNYSRTWKWEALKLKLAGVTPTYRPAETIGEMIRRSGFKVEFTGPSGGNEESVWFVGRGDYHKKSLHLPIP